MSLYIVYLFYYMWHEVVRKAAAVVPPHIPVSKIKTKSRATSLHSCRWHWVNSPSSSSSPRVFWSLRCVQLQNRHRYLFLFYIGDGTGAAGVRGPGSSADRALGVICSSSGAWRECYSKAGLWNALFKHRGPAHTLYYVPLTCRRKTSV